MNMINKSFSNALLVSDRRPGYSAADAAQLVDFVQQQLASPTKVLLALAGAAVTLMSALIAG